jgi:ABC-type uncharacterized transport system permease subunit
MRKLILIMLVLGIIAFVLTGCDHNSVFNIRVSGTIGLEFSGSYLVVMSNGQSASESVNGTVPYEISVTGTNRITISTVSVELQKQTEEGTLKVEILKDDQVIASSETAVAYGVVSVATE